MNEDIVLKLPEAIRSPQLNTLLKYALKPRMSGVKRVLLIPPDGTRSHSGGGLIASLLYQQLKGACRVDVLPALGTHEPMNPAELKKMFGQKIPMERFYPHNFREDTVKLGEIPAEFVKEVSGGRMDEPIDVELNKRLLKYDLILSVGQIVPHEVAGMAGYTKNLLVGCGGASMINATHYLGALHGIENTLGRVDTPVRQVFDYAHEKFLAALPVVYVLTVVGESGLNGVFIGEGRRVFDEAAAFSAQRNIKLVERPIKKAVAYMDTSFHSTWLANKAVYRLRLAMEDDGELLIVAPGVARFGEDAEIDRLIRKHGYKTTDEILKAMEDDAELKVNRSAAAHLMHGSSEGRFKITYATGAKLSRAAVEGVGYCHMPVDEALARYDVGQLEDGFQTMPDGEEIFFVGNPALGLWAHPSRFAQGAVADKE